MTRWQERLKRSGIAALTWASGAALAVAGFLGYYADTVQLGVAQIIVFCGAMR